MFYVVRKEVSFTVNITNITVDETLRFTVNFDNVNSGTVSAIISNKEYVEDVVNGVETFEIPTFKGTTVYEIETQVSAKISGEYKRIE